MNILQFIKNRLTDRPKGLTLPEYKSLSNHDGDIKALPIYDKYYVSLLQRDGTMAIPTVAIGTMVRAGDVIARPTSNVALHRHAPTSGEVSAIVDITETHPSGMMVKALEITADGYDTATDAFPAIPHHENAAREVLIERIFHAGIAGMGGAGFPTEKKINLTDPVDTLIINGAECEPYITCDDLLMRHHAEAILQGAFIFARILRAKNILIGIEDNKPEAIAAMQSATEKLAAQTDCHLAVHVLPTQYPMGSRHQIAHYLLGKRPNIKGRSHQSGFICHNVATAKAVFDAVALGKPLIERLVTFSGDGVGKAGVYATKCGTNFADIARDIALSEQLDEIIIGGTMMGFAISPELDKPMVIKRETTSILAFADRPPHTIEQDTAEENCIRCGQCADACPMDLLPQQLHFYGRGNDFEKLEQNRLFDCIECGLCNYVCPSNIPLVQVFQHSKGELIADKKTKAEAEHARIRFEARNERMEAEKAEKAKRAEERRAKLKKVVPKADNDDEKSTPTNKDDKADLIAQALARKQAKDTNKATVDNNSSADKQDLIAQALARRQEKRSAAHTEKPVTNDDRDNKQALIATAIARSQAKKQSVTLAESTHNNDTKATETSETPNPQQASQAAVAEVIAQRKAKKAQANANKDKDKEALIAEALAKREAKKQSADQTQKAEPIATTTSEKADNLQASQAAVAEVIAQRKAKKAQANVNKDKEALIAEALAKREAKKKQAQKTDEKST